MMRLLLLKNFEYSCFICTLAVYHLLHKIEQYQKQYLKKKNFAHANFSRTEASFLLMEFQSIHTSSHFIISIYTDGHHAALSAIRMVTLKGNS